MLYIVILLVAIIFWLVYEWAEHVLVQHNTTAVECVRLEEGEFLKLCLITDLHNNRKKAKKLFEQLRHYEPDMILLAGDMTNKHKKEQKNALHFLNELVQIAPVYYSLGNHEEQMRIYNTESWMTYKKSFPAGVILLDNSGTTASVRGKKYFISGLSLPEQFYKKGSLYFNKEELPELVVPKEMFHIMLAHHPEYAAWYEIYSPDLVVSGHLHGGLLRLPGIGGMLSPRLHIPKEDAGLYTYRYGKLYVSRGLGSHTIPLRFFNRVEINYLNLCSAKK